MYNKIISFLLLLLSSNSLSFAILPNDTIISDTTNLFYYPPLDIPLKLSGNFGDVRASSFHFGIDFRTEEKTGFPVYAVADGWVARTKVEPGGYGRAVYINHPNGTMSVYAHLESIYDSLAQYIKNEQYKRESFYVDLNFEKNQFPIKACDIIGRSGNAGMSSGPHLHFELRESVTQNTFNCFVAEFPMIDNSQPVIKNIWIYPSANYYSEESLPKKFYPVNSKNGKDKLDGSDTIPVPSYFGLGIEAFDFLTDDIRKLSFFSAKLFVDTTLYFHLEFDMLPFDQMSYVNSCIDIEQKKLENTNIYKLFKLPNQKVRVMKSTKNRGFISLSDSLPHLIKIVVSDINANSRTTEFYVRKTDDFPKEYYKTEKLIAKMYRWNESSAIELGQCNVSFPAGTFYADACISAERVAIKTQQMLYAPIYRIGENTIPTKAAFNILFPITKISEKIRNKLVVVSVSEKGNISSIGGTIENEHITVSSRTFGNFSLAVDTIAPQIVPQNISKNKNMTNENSIKIKIDDTLSGIGEYRGTIDSKWVLFEYDAKNDLLTHYFDSTKYNFNGQNHRLTLVVKDKRQNKKTYSVGFVK